MKIDVHAHVFPAAYLELLDRAGGSECKTDVGRNVGVDRTPEDMGRATLK